MRFSRGRLHVGHLGGVPISIHFTLPLGLLYFSSFQFRPGIWVGFLVLVLAHELGHAALVRHFGMRVALALLLERRLGSRIFGFPSAMLAVFIEPNVQIAVLNLLPIPPLDGAEAWRIFPLLYARLRPSLLVQRSRNEAPRNIFRSRWPSTLFRSSTRNKDARAEREPPTGKDGMAAPRPASRASAPSGAKSPDGRDVDRSGTEEQFQKILADILSAHSPPTRKPPEPDDN